MSAALKPDDAPDQGAVALLDTPVTAATVFAPGGVTSLLERITAQVRATEVDVSTPAGRTACKRLAAKVARSKTTLDGMGKALNEEARARMTATDADRRTIRETLDGLKAEVLAPLEAFEAREAQRVAHYEGLLGKLSWPADVIERLTVEGLDERLAELRAMTATGWEEFAPRATRAIAEQTKLIEAALEAAQAREVEAARAYAEQVRIEGERLQEENRLRFEREARIAAEAAETARLAAEQEAERQRQAAHDAECMRLAEIEAEHRRQVEAAAQAERDRAATVEAEHARQVEAAEQVRRVADRERIAAEQRAQRAEQDQLNVEAEAEDRRQHYEADRSAAAERAEQDRVAAVDAERQRIAAELAEAQEAARKREADKVHRASRNNEVAAALVEHAGLSAAAAKATVTAMAKRLIPHTTISY